MTTTELIELLKSVEYGASGRAREVNIIVKDMYIDNAEIEIGSSGDGAAGASLTLRVWNKDVPIDMPD